LLSVERATRSSRHRRACALAVNATTLTDETTSSARMTHMRASTSCGAEAALTWSFLNRMLKAERVREHSKRSLRRSRSSRPSMPQSERVDPAKSPIEQVDRRAAVGGATPDQAAFRESCWRAGCSSIACSGPVRPCGAFEDIRQRFAAAGQRSGRSRSARTMRFAPRSAPGSSSKRPTCTRFHIWPAACSRSRARERCDRQHGARSRREDWSAFQRMTDLALCSGACYSGLSGARGAGECRQGASWSTPVRPGFSATSHRRTRRACRCFTSASFVRIGARGRCWMAHRWSERGLALLRRLGLAPSATLPPIPSSGAAGACSPQSTPAGAQVLAARAARWHRADRRELVQLPPRHFASTTGLLFADGSLPTRMLGFGGERVVSRCCSRTAGAGCLAGRGTPSALGLRMNRAHALTRQGAAARLHAPARASILELEPDSVSPSCTSRSRALRRAWASCLPPFGWAEALACTAACAGGPRCSPRTATRRCGSISRNRRQRRRAARPRTAVRVERAIAAGGRWLRATQACERSSPSYRGSGGMLALAGWGAVGICVARAEGRGGGR